MVGAHGGNAGKSGNAVLNMHHIVARGYINKELVVWHRAFLYQPVLLDKTEDFGVSEQVGITVHYPALSQCTLNQGQ
ncbi:hypothetical protein ES703_49688 [subsurface metagenome]